MVALGYLHRPGARDENACKSRFPGPGRVYLRPLLPQATPAGRFAGAESERKATPEELDDYKRFVLNVADKVANAHREGGETVSADEHAAIDAIAANLGTATP